MSDSAERRLPEALRKLLPLEIQAQCASAPCARGELLFKQGKKPSQMFYVTRGELVLQRSGRQGAIVVLQRTRRGFIGEASLDSVRYHCDALVTMSGEVVAIPLAAVKQALAADSGFAGRWIAMLNQEMKRLRAQCERRSMRGVGERLLHLIETEGSEGRLPLGGGLKSMASELGVTHEALYRAVAELEKKGVLRRRENCLIVVGGA
jgi:CRP-like cAMP-binding protein